MGNFSQSCFLWILLVNNTLFRIFAERDYYFVFLIAIVYFLGIVLLISDLINWCCICPIYIGIGMRKVALFAVLAIFLMSCSETKRVTYLQKVESLPVEVLQQKSLLADPRIVPGDLLSISVGSDSPESVSIFNKLSSSGTTENAMTSSSVSDNSTYLVDNKGIIDFPIIGKLNVGGMTRTEAEEFIKSKIYPQYVKKNRQ